MVKISIGTDCAGIEAPIEALLQLKKDFIHKWSCDNNKYCKKMIELNYNPEKFYDDIFDRDYDELPDIDIYVCGFPALKNYINLPRRF